MKTLFDVFEEEDISSKATRGELYNLIKDAWQASSTRINIKNAWKTVGLSQ